MDKLWFLSTGLVLLAWILSSCISRRRPPLVNYGELRHKFFRPKGACWVGETIYQIMIPVSYRPIIILISHLSVSE